MKKKLGIVLSFVLAFAMSLALFAGCGGGKENKDDVTVTLSPTTATIETGKTRKLTAIVSDGVSEVEWSSSDDSIASVDGGTVKGESAGKATITATVKGGTANATCEVTVKDPVVVTIKDASGATITETLSMDRKAGSVQLSATASDGSTISSWSTADSTIATVDSTGLVTPVKEGDTSLTARSSTGSATINIHVFDTAEHKEIVNGSGSATAGNWWYYLSSDNSREPAIVTNEVREGVVAFEFGGNCNWNVGDVQLGLKKDATAKSGWAALSIIIKSNVDGTIRIFDTDVAIENGDNAYTVYYDQSINENMVYITPHNDIPIGRFEIKISDISWVDYTQQQLETPTFTLSGDTITISDTNPADGILRYEVGFFNGETLVASQSFTTKTYTINAAAIETNGTYTLKVRAVGIPGYITTDWSETEEQYEVNNQGITYDLERTTEVSDQYWTYYTVHEDSVGDPSVAKYEDGVITFEIDYLGWKYDSTQMMRRLGQFDVGTPVKLTMKIESSQAGRITVSGTVVNLVAGENTFDVFTTQPASGATITILFGENTTADSGMDWNGAVQFKIQLISAVDYTPTPLKTPSYSYESESKKITVIDSNDESIVSKYEVGFFDSSDKLIGTATIADDGTFSDLAIKDGTYSLKVRTVSKTPEYTTSAWSEVVVTDYEVKNGGISYGLKFGGDNDSENAITNPDTWYYWNDQNWTGSSVTINQAVYSSNTVTISYTVNNGACDYGVQLYYKNTGLAVGSTYALTLKFHVDEAVDVVINGNAFSLVKGDNDITAYYKEAVGIGYSFSMQLRVDRSALTNNTIVLSEMTWTPYTYVSLEAPSIQIGSDGIVTITDINKAGVAGYVAGFYQGTTLVSTVAVFDGKAVDVSAIPNGEYTVKIMAKGLNGYNDSDWSATGVTYTVAKASNTIDLVNTLDNAEPVDGWYYYATTNADSWNNWTAVNVTKAVYDLDTKVATFVYTATGSNAWSFQMVYKFPSGTNSVKVRIQTDFNCTIETVRGVSTPSTVTANTPVEITFTGTEAYIQIPVTSTVTGGTVTLTLVD